MILFNTANVASFDHLTSFSRLSQPGQLKKLMLDTWPDQPLRVVYTPLEGDKMIHFDYVCQAIKICGNLTFGVDEIDAFMTANDLGPKSFYELVNYGRHLKVAMIGTTRNTVAVSRQYTSMLTEICIFDTSEPRYLKYFEDTCGAQASGLIPLLGKHEYVRWLANGHCERRKGWR